MTRDVKLKAANGKELPAIKVIMITLEHLKSLILKDIDEQIPHPNMRIQWILTVPAIWSEGAKQMMRQAAEEVCALRAHYSADTIGWEILGNFH